MMPAEPPVSGTDTGAASVRGDGDGAGRLALMLVLPPLLPPPLPLEAAATAAREALFMARRTRGDAKLLPLAPPLVGLVALVGRGEAPCGGRPDAAATAAAAAATTADVAADGCDAAFDPLIADCEAEFVELACRRSNSSAMASSASVRRFTF